MFKNTNMVGVNILANSLHDSVSIVEPSLLASAIHREITAVEYDDIESLLAFYQKDAHHETLMSDISDSLAKSISGLISKVQNELLDLVDTTFEEVKDETHKLPTDIITHKTQIIPEIKFIASDYSSEVESTNISNRSRLAVNVASGTKFATRDARELLNRISKTMSSDTFTQFVDMITALEIDLVYIYDVVIRSKEAKVTPLASTGPMRIAYTYLEAVAGYHIAQSLLQEHDDETRLPELQYNEYIGAKVNNMTIRYKSAVSGMIAALDSKGAACRFEDGVFVATIYSPVLEKATSEDKTQQQIIDEILSNGVNNTLGRIPNTTSNERYAIYRKDIVSKHRLSLSSTMVRETIRSLEKFVMSKDFDVWWSANNDGTPTEANRSQYLAKARSILSNVSIGSDDDLYRAIIDVVCEVFYTGRMKKFVSDIRITMASEDVKAHEALGIVVDKLIVSYLVDMLKV